MKMPKPVLITKPGAVITAYRVALPTHVQRAISKALQDARTKKGRSRLWGVWREG